jgi:ribosomal-protein-alanine N-acetyltransferase
MRHCGTQPIETARLLLRRITLADTDAVFGNWANDAEVTRFMRWIPHENTETTVKVVSQWVSEYLSDNRYHWGISLDGVLIGSIGVFNISEHDRTAEIGFCVGRAWWGRGFVTEAAAAVVDYMFSKTEIERVEAFHSVENPASGAVLRKIGMTWEGTARHKYRGGGGNFHDCELYAIIRGDWRSE